MTGTFAFMLHAHIPFCRKSGVWPAGEEWLFEAMHETYLPLLSILRQFQRENLKPRIMVGIVPILAEQLADPYMNDRFCTYMEGKLQRAERDLTRFAVDDPKRGVAQYYLDFFQQTYDAYRNHFYRNIMGSFKWLQDAGIIEVLSSSATHGLLPLMERDSAVYSQIHLGIQTYEKFFGRRPKGFWVPECAYRPQEWSNKERRMRRGIDEWLADEKVQFFFVENIGIERAKFVDNKHHEPSPTTSRGYKLESGVCVFGRNAATGKQVWSPDGGYPGDPDYREFHKKDAESGLQYWRVTRRDPKEVYNPKRALERVETHADHFAHLLQEKMQETSRAIMECPPVIASPYDCELFGHWWHEGPAWINAVYRRLLQMPASQMSCLSLDEYIDKYGDTFSTIQMQPSTWGVNGDFSVWQHPDHNWIWPYINSCSQDVENAVQGIREPQQPVGNRGQRILAQLGRELLLLEGSDWPFLLYTKQAKEYANQRFHAHHQRLLKLLWAAKNVDEPQRVSNRDLQEMEDIDNPWSSLDVRIFQRK